MRGTDKPTDKPRYDQILGFSDLSPLIPVPRPSYQPISRSRGGGAQRSLQRGRQVVLQVVHNLLVPSVIFPHMVLLLEIRPSGHPSMDGVVGLNVGLGPDIFVHVVLEENGHLGDLIGRLALRREHQLRDGDFSSVFGVDKGRVERNGNCEGSTGARGQRCNLKLFF